MSEFTGERIKVEHAFHVGEKREKRRKLMAQRVKTLIATGVAAATFLGVGKVIEQTSEANYQPDSYYNGKIEIVMSPNLNLRESPIVINHANDEPNTVDWSSLEAIKGQGDQWVNVKGKDGFIIQNPLITEGDDPATTSIEKGAWITFDAKVDQPFGDPKEEKLYVSLSNATSEYVKPVESGSFIKINSDSIPSTVNQITTP